MHSHKTVVAAIAPQLRSRCSSNVQNGGLCLSSLTRHFSVSGHCSNIVVFRAPWSCYPQPEKTLIHVSTIDQGINTAQTRQLSSLPRLPKAPCPFRVLKIPKDSSYAHAKKSFLKIAMKHHPDTFSDEDNTEEKRQKSQEIFMRSRSALESLVECESTGLALLRSEVEEAAASRTMSNEEFDSWFEKETGRQSPFAFDLDPQTMREVASMHDDMEGSHGLDRDGGMWHLASLISKTVKDGKEGAADLLKLEAGHVKEVEAEGKLEKRRRRPRGRR